MNQEDQKLSGEVKAPPESEETKEAAQPEKKKRDCRDHCMHCGMHCIYLQDNKPKEE